MSSSLPAAFVPVTVAALGYVTKPEPTGPAFVVVPTPNGSFAEAPVAMVPVYVTWNAVMYCPGASVGVVGRPEAAVNVESAGALPVLTDHETVAPVAPSGHAAPEVKPENEILSEKNVPVPGSRTDRVVSGPVEVFVAVRVAVVDWPAGSCWTLKLLSAETLTVSGAISCAAVAGLEVASPLGVVTEAVIELTRVPPATRVASVRRFVARWANTTSAEPFAPGAMVAPCDELKTSLSPITSPGSTLEGRVGVVPIGPATSPPGPPSWPAVIAMTCTWSAPAGNVTAPNPAKS